MPARVRNFESEYQRMFRPFDIHKVHRPINLRPRPSPVKDGFDLAVELEKRNAGLKSVEAKVQQEPQLQRKKIVQYNKNHNVFKTFTIPNEPADDSSSTASKNIENIENAGNKATVQKETSVQKENKTKRKANRALQFQAGMHHIKPDSKKFLSEYQRQFPWRENVIKESPILTAEHIIHSSNTNVPGGNKPAEQIQQKSEYQYQFQKWATKPVKKPVDDQQDKENNSPRDASPERLPAAGVPPMVSPHEKRLQVPSQNPQQPFFPTGSTREFASEYKSNFQSPLKFKLKHGAWKGADPPHLRPDKPDTPEKPLDDVEVISNESGDEWFKQVMELRQKAHSYFLRDRDGNHFSRSYLKQLEDELANLLVKTSKNGSGKAGGAEDPSSQPPKKPEVREAWTETPDKLVRKRSESVESMSHSSAASEAGSYRQNVEKASELSGYTSDSDDSNNIIYDDKVGRQRTPELCTEVNGRRHHLDATTPVVGGALLSSPVLSKPLRKATYKITTSKNEASVDNKTKVIHRDPEPELHIQQATQTPDRFSDAGSEMDFTMTPEKEDDVMSESAMSNRSSIAVQTLDRAMKRRKDFWKKNGTVA